MIGLRKNQELLKGNAVVMLYVTQMWVYIIFNIEY